MRTGTQNLLYPRAGIAPSFTVPNSESSRPEMAETIGFSSKALTRLAASSRFEALFRFYGMNYYMQCSQQLAVAPRIAQ